VHNFVGFRWDCAVAVVFLLFMILHLIKKKEICVQEFYKYQYCYAMFGQFFFFFGAIDVLI
jgi:hypothetical protein